MNHGEQYFSMYCLWECGLFTSTRGYWCIHPRGFLCNCTSGQSEVSYQNRTSTRSSSGVDFAITQRCMGYAKYWYHAEQEESIFVVNSLEYPMSLLFWFSPLVSTLYFTRPKTYSVATNRSAIKEMCNLHFTRTKRCTHDYQTLSYLHG